MKNQDNGSCSGSLDSHKKIGDNNRDYNPFGGECNVQNGGSCIKIPNGGGDKNTTQNGSGDVADSFQINGMSSNNNQYYDKQGKLNYEQSIAYENMLRKELDEIPLISPKTTIKILIEEYKNNLEYTNSISNITNKYTWIRKVRRDGNCFYRAFIYRLFEHIAINKDEELYGRVLSKIREARNLTERNGYEWTVVEDFYNIFENSFNNVFNCDNKGKVREKLDESFADKDKGNYLIYFIRLCIAAYLKENKILYEYYVEDSFERWIQTEVEPIDHEADQIQIMAAVSYFDFGVKIECLNKHKGELMKFPEDKKDEDIFITVLFTPGHYDILYENNEE